MQPRLKQCYIVIFINNPQPSLDLSKTFDLKHHFCLSTKTWQVGQILLWNSLSQLAWTAHCVRVMSRFVPVWILTVQSHCYYHHINLKRKGEVVKGYPKDVFQTLKNISICNGKSRFRLLKKKERKER